MLVPIVSELEDGTEKEVLLIINIMEFESNEDFHKNIKDCIESFVDNSI
jgi:hypothetical protein